MIYIAGRLASGIVTLLGAAAAFFATDVTTVFRLVIAIGTGPGLVLILRWFWWRINAAAELASMVAGLAIGFTTSVVPLLQIEDFGLRLLVISGLTTVIWGVVMALTPPESDATLDAFYRKVRPGGPGWRRQRRSTRLPAAQDLGHDALRVLAALLLLFGAMLSIGGFLLYQPLTGWLALIAAGLGWYWLRQLGSYVVPMPRPGLDDGDRLT